MIRSTAEYDALYRRIAPGLFRRAFILLRDEEEARDCVQSAFMSLWENRDEVNNPEAFVNTLANNYVAAHYRSLSVRERFAMLYPIETEINADEDFPDEEIRRFVRENLTESVRRVVEAVFFLRMSYKECAAALGISVATVNKHVVTALRLLRQKFNNVNK